MTVAELILLAGQLIVLGFQAYYLRGTLQATKISADAAKASTEATKIAADAARKSADVAEESVNNIERPYLLVGEIAPLIAEFLGGPSDQPTMPHVVVTLKNYGRSPALLLEYRACIELMQPDQNIPFLPVLPLGNVIVVGPKDVWKHTRYYQSAVGPGIEAQVDREQLHMWFFASIRYEDMLGKEHQTQMRFRYEPREKRFSMPTGDSYTIRT